MRSKTPLFLMEQLIMILVFSIAAILCLQGFTTADRLSQEQTDVSQAVVLAQNMAELLKAHKGDYQTAAEQFADYSAECIIKIYNTEAENDSDVMYLFNDSVSSTSHTGYELHVTELKTESSFLTTVLIEVLLEDEILFELTTAWQEAAL